MRLEKYTKTRHWNRMPAINQPKLGELYNTTFFTPSSLISSIIIPQSNVAWTDGQGGVYYVAALTLPMMISTVDGLGTAGYVSSTQLLSTVADLGTAGYISSTQLLSTVADLGSGGYISSTQLLSTVEGLGAAGYLSTLTVQGYFYSTTAGLGNAGYVSSTQLASTLEYIQSHFVSTPSLLSTVDGLASANYVSSTQLISTTNYFLQNYVSSGQALSTTQNLGSLNYVSTSQLISTVDGLGVAAYVSSTQLISSIDYILTNYVSTGQLVSTVNNLGSINYISSTQLTSTVAGLGTANYVSSTQLVSTTEYIINNYVSSGQLLSTTAGLGTANYISSTQLISTVVGLGTANYVSSTQLISTTNYFLQNYVSSGQALSTTKNLGSLGYVSSLSLISTVDALITNLTVQTLRVVDTLSTTSTFTQFISTTHLLASTVSANTIVVWGKNTLIVQGASLLSTTTVTGNLNVSTVSGTNGFVNSAGVSTNQVQTSSILFRDTAAPAVTYNVYANSGLLYVDSEPLIYNSLLAAKLVSTVNNLGSVNYVSSTQLASTVNNLGSLNYISSSQLTSTVEGLSFATFVSSTQLASTVAGLGTAGYISSQQLLSSVAGLGTANYVSSTQLASTVAGLGTATYISSPQLLSTTAGLGTAGYISSQQLTSTFDGLTRGFVTSSLNVATSIYAQSTYTKFASTTHFLGLDITAKKVLPVAAQNLATSANLNTWTNPVAGGFLTQGNAVCAGNNLWVAVGDSSNAAGSIKWSVDGLVWNDALSGGFTNSAGDHIGYAIAYSPQQNIYVAGGYGTGILTSILQSTDGKHWGIPANGISMPVYGITWASNVGGGRWVAVGNGNGLGARSIAYSSNGVNWTPAANGFSNNSSDPCVGYGIGYSGSGTFVAVGYGDSNNNMLRSVDGINWVKRGYPGGYFFDHDGGFGVAYSPTLSRWVAVGNVMNPLDSNRTILYSPDATGLGSWTIAATGGFPGAVGNGVIWNGSQFVAVGAGSEDGSLFQTSTDGISWSATSAAPFEYFGSYIANGIAYSNSQYVAVGDGETTNGGALVTLVNPSSISTKTITAEEIIVDTITVTGPNTLIVNGNSYFDGPAEFSTSVTTSSMNVNGDANFLGNLTMFGSNAGVSAAFLSTLQVTTSSIRLTDIHSSTITNSLYSQNNTLYFNSNPVLIGGGSSGSDLTVNNMNVLSTISTSSTFTNYISAAKIITEYVSTRNIYVCTISMKDILLPGVTHRLYASSQQLYFDNINITSSFAGNGCGVCIDSNIGFSNVLVYGTLSSLSTYTTFISTGTLRANTITTNTMNLSSLNTTAISTANAQTSSLTLQDTTLGNLYNLYAQAGTLYFNGNSIGTIPNVVNSNLWVDTLRVNYAISSASLFTNTISSGATSVSTMNLIDQQTNAASPLFAAGGVLYFKNNQVLPYGPDMMFSTIAVGNTISTSSTFMKSLSTAQINVSSITATDLALSKISTLQVQTSSIRFVDTAAVANIQPLVNTNGSLLFNGMALGLGGTVGYAPQFSTLRVAQNVSTSSTFTNFISAGQVLTSSVNAQVLTSIFASTANTAVSSLTFVSGTNRLNMYGTASNLFYNNSAIPLGGSNSQNSVLSSMTLFNSLTASSISTNLISSMTANVYQVQNTSSMMFIDSATGGTNYLYTKSGVLWLNNSPGIGVISVASNLVLSNLQVLDTLSTTSTFVNFISSGLIGASTISTTFLSVYETTVTDRLEVNNAVVAGDATVNTVNTRPYPILNWGRSNIECCGIDAGFRTILFTYPYNTTPAVTVSVSDAENDIALLNVPYIDTVSFVVASYQRSTGLLQSTPNITFTWTAMGT